MALSPKLDLRLGQTLVMTPQLQQAIKLLQLSNIELSAYVESEIEQNPLLERESDDGPDLIGETGEVAGIDAGDAIDAAAGDGLAPTDGIAAEIGAEAMDPVAHLDADYDNLWSSDAAGAGGVGPPMNWRNASSGDADGADIGDQTPAEPRDLRTHLVDQITMELDDPVDRVIAAHLIEMLDEAGYISDDLTPIARQLNCEVARIERTLERVQRFDPPGLFARSLAECLAIQLRERNRLDPAMQTLLDNLDLLADQDYETLRARCGVDEDDFSEMLAEIRALNPKPGLAFDNEPIHTVVPDIFLRVRADGEWVIELNNETLPRVLVNRSYYALVHRQARTREEKEYIADRLHSANWLVKSLDQRANTIMRVATELVRQQSDFFRHGVRHLKPLIMRDIAAAIDMHESTVSRVINNKYMATPRGTYELRYFFTNAIASTDGGGAGHSSEAVRHRIRDLIENEDPESPLSDDRLVALLKADGIDIARRTVAKYREAMRIPSSLARRRNHRRARKNG